MAGLSLLVAALPSFPTSAEISYNLRQVIGSLGTMISNFNAGGVTNTYLEALAVALGSDSSSLANSSVEGAYEILQMILTGAYIASASGNYLDLKAADVGVFRKIATYATTSVLFVASSAAPSPGGTLIAAGTIVASEPADPTQAPILFVTLVSVTMAAGAIVSPAAVALAVGAGSAGNVAANTVTQVLSGNGMTCYNPIPASGGTDQEGDDLPNGGLRARALAAIANASQCTISAIAEAALSYDGITSSEVVDLTAADGVTFERGNVLVYCDDGTGNLGSALDANNASLLAFQADLNAGKWRAAGITVLAIGSILLPVTISLSIDCANSYIVLGNTTTAVALAVQDAVYGYVQILPLGEPVTLASIATTAMGVLGVSNVLLPSIIINGVAADLYALPQQVPRCTNGPSDVTITVNAITKYD